MQPPKSRGGAREQIVLKICKPISGPPTHYMTSSWVSKWSSINCAWTDGARFSIPEVLPVLFKNASFNISSSAKRICFVIKIDQSQQTIAQNDQWNLRIISSEKKFGFGVKLQISAHLGSNFEVHWKWVNCISKWRSWRQNFKKEVARSLEVTRGQKSEKRSNF